MFDIEWTLNLRPIDSVIYGSTWTSTYSCCGFEADDVGSVAERSNVISVDFFKGIFAKSPPDNSTKVAPLCLGNTSVSPIKYFLHTTKLTAGDMATPNLNCDFLKKSYLKSKKNDHML